MFRGPCFEFMSTSSIASNAAEAWRKYVSVGAINPHLLRPHVLQAWVRSHDQGASAWVARAEMLSPTAAERLLEQQARLIAAAYPYMHLLSKAAGAERHAMTLGTVDAIVIVVVGDEQSVSGPERVPGPGSLLSEAVCGSSGIGTPLVEGRYIEIISTEHFIHGFHPFICHGIPIESLEGEYAGVLSATVLRPDAVERMPEILVCSAHGIATELARLQLADRVHDVIHAGEPDCATMEGLHRVLVRLEALPPKPHPMEGGGRSIIQAMMELLRVADEARRRLEQHERAWRELAMNDLGMATRVELTDEVSDLLELLGPEIRRRRVEVTYRPRGSEHVTAFADRRELRRTVFRQLLRGIDMAEAGGAMVVDLESEPPHTLCTLRVETIPAPNSLGAMSITSVVFPRWVSGVSPRPPPY